MKKDIIIIIQLVLFALLLVYTIIQKMDADKQRERVDWMQLEAEKVKMRTEKLFHEIDSLKKLQRNPGK